MKKDDAERFALVWQTAHGVYGKPVQPETIALVFRVLEPYELHDVENALGAHLRDQDTGQYPPKPADVVRRIEGQTDAKVAMAYASFRQAIRDRRTPDDPAVAECVRRMGGLHDLGGRSSRDLDFLLDQFRALYLAYSEPSRLGINGPKLRAVTKEVA